MAISRALGLQSEPEITNRWLQLLACVIAMMTIANLRYPRTLESTPASRPSGFHLRCSLPYKRVCAIGPSVFLGSSRSIRSPHYVARTPTPLPCKNVRQWLSECGPLVPQYRIGSFGRKQT